MGVGEGFAPRPRAEEKGYRTDMTRASRVVVALVLAAIPAVANAQTAERRWYAGAGIGWQIGSEDSVDVGTFNLYDEPGEIRTTYDYNRGGAMLDVEFGYVLSRKLAVSLLITRTGAEYDAPIEASVPSPLATGQHRTATGTATDLSHTEGGIHIQFGWLVNNNPNLELRLTFGPSIIRLTRDVVTGVVPGPETPPFDTVTITDAVTTENSDNGFGFNLGGEGVYALGSSGRFGLRTFVRYIFVPVEMTMASQDDTITTGGFQLGAGLRIRF